MLVTITTVTSVTMVMIDDLHTSHVTESNSTPPSHHLPISRPGLIIRGMGACTVADPRFPRGSANPKRARTYSRAVLGFPVGGDANPPGGASTYDFAKIPKTA